MKSIRHRFRTAIGGSVALLFLLLHGITYAQSVEDRLERQVDQFNAVGLAVVVVMDSEIFYTNSFGWRDKDAQIDKNTGKLLVLDATSDNIQLFDSIQSNVQLTKAYEKPLDRIENKEGYKSSVHGPNACIHSLKSDDLVFLDIPSRENGTLSLIDSNQKEVLAIGHINSIEDGPNGEIKTYFKVASP